MINLSHLNKINLATAAVRQICTLTFSHLPHSPPLYFIIRPESVQNIMLAEHVFYNTHH